jgi:two-component SAPR family response regulator
MTLQIRSLGRAEVTVNGKPADWHAESARDLFFYLLSYPEGRSREDILFTLWDATKDAASSNRFRVTMHRVRQALQNPHAIIEEYGRYRLAPDVLRASDIQELYLALERAEHAQTQEDRLSAYQHVLAVYGGDYLPDQRADWATQARDEHRNAYVRAAIELSLLHCDAHSCESAVGALSRALRADPFIGENYHQKLMTCLSVVEGKYAAIEHYRRFLKFLRDELEDTPMPETLDLAEVIKMGEQICRRRYEGPVAHEHTTDNCPFTPDGRCRGSLVELETVPG